MRAVNRTAQVPRTGTGGSTVAEGRARRHGDDRGGPGPGPGRPVAVALAPEREARRAKHERAVARTLEFADEAAGRGDFRDALAWLATLEAIGRRLSDEYLVKQAEWRLAVTATAERRIA